MLDSLIARLFFDIFCFFLDTEFFFHFCVICCIRLSSVVLQKRESKMVDRSKFRVSDTVTRTFVILSFSQQPFDRYVAVSLKVSILYPIKVQTCQDLW